MSKEYLWTLTVDGEDKDWKCVVTDDECILYEENAETKRLPIECKLKNVVQVDEVIDVFGAECGFQLENNIPYIKINGSWKMSDTTYHDRQIQMEKNARITGWVQSGMGVVMCLVYLVMWLMKVESGSWWILLIFGSVMIVFGLMQVYSVKKESGKD